MRNDATLPEAGVMSPSQQAAGGSPTSREAQSSSATPSAVAAKPDQRKSVVTPLSEEEEVCAVTSWVRAGGWRIGACFDGATRRSSRVARTAACSAFEKQLALLSWQWSADTWQQQQLSYFGETLGHAVIRTSFAAVQMYWKDKSAFARRRACNASTAQQSVDG